MLDKEDKLDEQNLLLYNKIVAEIKNIQNNEETTINTETELYSETNQDIDNNKDNCVYYLIQSQRRRACKRN